MAGPTHPEFPEQGARTSDYSSLLDKLERVLEDCKAKASPFALLVVDLSRITTLIPVLGYRKTEQVFIAIEARLMDIKRPADILVRVTDFRFALIIPDLKFASMAELAANKITESLHGLHEFTGLDTTINPGTGIALFPEHAETAEELLLEAETSTQIALERNIHTMVAGGDNSKQIHLSRQIGADLESAFRKSELELYYQPQISLGSGQLRGAEALIRWQHPEFGFVSPDILIPIIEKSHLMSKITLWILNTALNQANSMRRQSPDFRIAVNLSPGLLNDPDLVELVERSLRIWNTRPEHLILEVTETSMMQNLENSLRTLQRLNEIGVLLSIDDFGTGYSSFSYLQQLPVHELKIDRSFITDMPTDNNGERVVSAMIKLGKEFGMDVLAEGIETHEVYQCLVEMDCEYGQGFHIARPMPYRTMLLWINSIGARESATG
jgi:EAL domain-containing protein (putative c-di-GMP-specific phosphodiesterase class I)/GGDEF domain-containing protein